MRSVNSFFNGALYKKNMMRYWPVWMLYMVIWIFALPVNGWLVGQRYNSDAQAFRVFNFAEETVLRIADDMAVPMGLIFGILGAMAVFSYLYQSRSAGMLHSLPIRREGLFLTNYLSGLTFFVLPNVVVAALTLAVEGTLGYVAVAPVAMWFVVQSAVVLFFYSFGVFCAMFTGHILALPAFYFILNYLVMAVTGLVENLMRTTLFGFNGLGDWNVVAQWFTPVARLSSALRVLDQTEYLADDVVGPMGYIYEMVGLETTLVYGAVGLVFAVVAMLCYRRHRVESAGDVVSVPWVYALFKYGVTFCMALALGTLLYTMFAVSRFDGGWSMLGFILLSGVVGYFGAEMLLQKSFRVWRAWRGCVVSLVCLTALVASFELDVYGFETRLPQLSEVESIWGVSTHSAPYDEGNGLYCEWTDPEEIGAILAIHQAILDEKELTERAQRNGYDMVSVPVETTEGLQLAKLGVKDFDLANFEVVYYLTDGSQLTRRYSNIIVTSERLDDPTTAAALLENFINLPENVTRVYCLDEWIPEELNEVSISYFNALAEDEQDGIDLMDAEQQQALLNAVLADFAEGNLGRRYLLTDGLERYQQTSLNDIRFMFLRREEGEWQERNYTVTPTPQARHTIEMLTQAGILDEEHMFITHEGYELWANETDKKYVD